MSGTPEAGRGEANGAYAGMHSAEMAEARRIRDARWIEAFKRGESCRAIGRRDGVSGERVRQIIRKAGLGYHSGGCGLGLKGAAAERDALDRAVRKEKRRGLPKGVYHQTLGHTFRVQFRGRHVGSFASIDDAVAARKDAELAEVEVRETARPTPRTAGEPR